MNTPAAAPLSIEDIAQCIRIVRGKRVLLDADLAAFYGVSTKRFNEQVRRNQSRFPADFMFSLSGEEFAALRSQFATSNIGRGGRRYAPYVFTEHGAIMAATLLNTPRATEISVHVVRAFIELRDLVAGNRAFAVKLGQLERKVASHDESIHDLIDSMRQLLAPADPPKRSIGFVLPDETGKPAKAVAKRPRAGVRSAAAGEEPAQTRSWSHSPA